MRLTSRSGLAVEINANGSIRRLDHRDIAVNLFPGNEVEGGPANVYLRARAAAGFEFTPLLGPCSPLRFVVGDRGFAGEGTWQGIRFSLSLVLADAAPAWFWHVALENTSSTEREVDLVYAQDIALSSYAAVRLNEYYVSHYIDHEPLSDGVHGWVLASRQNLAVGGRHPWALIGSLRRGVAFATDALQVYGLAARAGAAPIGLRSELPSVRWQHEHSMVAIQDAPIVLLPGAQAGAGFFGWLEADHSAATDAHDLALIERALALPEAQPPARLVATEARSATPTLFAPARPLQSLDLDETEIEARFGANRRHEERDASGRLLSFFHGDDRHVVLRAKELQVLRPHGHILRTGRVLAPDETALTSTAWMAGVFDSMLTQGHVAINRFLSTVRSYLALFRSQGLRVFVEMDGAWQLLDVPSAFEMAPDQCRWIYRHAGGTIEVHSRALGDPHSLGLRLEVVVGDPARFLISQHIALDGDDGSAAGPARFTVDGDAVVVMPSPASELGRRFPDGGFRIEAAPGTRFERVGGDELLFADGEPHGQPFVCIVTAPKRAAELRLQGALVKESADVPASDVARSPAWRIDALPRLHAPAASKRAGEVAALNDIVPWYAHNALVHFMSPRGLEQFSGGGWGTRDVCQGPVELLLALQRPQPIRALLLRVFAAQNPDGDWPQWFTFFERERAIRAADSHGDIVFWPLLALARYLIATNDASLLDERVAYFGAHRPAGDATVAEHVERALALIASRTIAGTRLAAFGHGDWNDALQPADPEMRERMCSAWTVTLHYQTLTTLAAALRRLGLDRRAEAFERDAQAVREDFHRWLMPDGIVAGYALFDSAGRIDYLLHPSDRVTGVRYSLLPMIHAILADVFSPAQARAHLALIRTQLTAPDGVRLFDRPMAYHGGLQRYFQRAEAASFFGREIGLMYTHAHLRYAEALAHMGEADGFFDALARANPIGIRQLVPSANWRQSNCYYSSSDAAFRDRYEASESYERVAAGTVALEGGWRVYSSGPGIALSLMVGALLGIRQEAARLIVDPVLPRALDGLRVAMSVGGRPIEIVYQVGRSGCGPVSVMLNGAPLAFERGADRYRAGGAEIRWGEFFARLSGQRDRLTVTLR
jgi:cellobiose phosphorylase